MKRVLPLLTIILLFTALSHSVLSEDITCTFTAFDPNFDSSVSFTSPSPSNESWQPITDGNLSIHVSNELGETMNVSFYNATGVLLGYNDSANNDTTVNITHPQSPYNNYQQYYWYATINSTNYNNQSATYWFKGEAWNYDINRDSTVNQTDLSSLHSSYLQTTSSRNDINGDGIVNYLDRSKLQHHWGETYS
jgi:hypothetical protein